MHCYFSTQLANACLSEIMLKVATPLLQIIENGPKTQAEMPLDENRQTKCRRAVHGCVCSLYKSHRSILQLDWEYQERSLTVACAASRMMGSEGYLTCTVLMVRLTSTKLTLSFTNIDHIQYISDVYLNSMVCPESYVVTHSLLFRYSYCCVRP